MFAKDFMIAEHIPEPILVVGRDGKANMKEPAQKIIWGNAAAESWLRQSCSALAGRQLTDISSDFDIIENKLADITIEQGSIRGRELTIDLGEDRKFICSYLVFPCQNGVGVLIKPRQIGLGLNAGTRRDGSVTMLGRMLAHELKNPLAGIRGAAQLLESELTAIDDLELTSLITTEVDRIGRLVEQIEKFGTDEKAIYENFNVHTILRNAKLLFHSQNKRSDTKEIDLVESYDPSLPDVFGDRDALMQVVVNLIANAIEAIHSTQGSNGECGKVEIKTLYRAGINRRRADGSIQSLPVEIRIIDNGPGVSDNLRERVFQPFVTGKANGHGLGLALVSTIIERHGGMVDLTSKPGRTVFSLLLPITPTTNISSGV